MGILRLLLAFSVLETHVFQFLKQPESGGVGLVFGQEAVQIFFIISGFYMALILHEKYNRPGDYGQFLLQRFLRLYPAYLLVLVIIAVVELGVLAASGTALGPFYYLRKYPQIHSAFSLGIYDLINLGVVGLESLCFFRQDCTTGQLYFGMPPPGTFSLSCNAFVFNPPAWSLAIEFLFYLVAPFIVRRSVTFQMVLLGAMLVLRYAIFYSTMWDRLDWLTSFFPSVLGFFIAGSLGYRFYRRYLKARESQPAWVPWGLAFFALILLFYRRLPHVEDFEVLFIPLSAAMIPFFFAVTRKLTWDRAIGELSYPFYLTHWLPIAVLMGYPKLGISPWIEPACLLFTLATAFLLNACFERRVESWREALFRRKRTEAPNGEVRK